ncbi:MAG: hypothetical protein J5940_03725, partial [Clostridia bacterium]|nr:hypothetical protein [Clostridia bacterium]
IIDGGYFGDDPGTWLCGYVRVPDDEVDQDALDRYFVNKWGEFVSYTELDEWDKENFTEYYIYSDTCWADFVIFSAEPEQFADQTDWNADGAEYPWRVRSFIAGDINGDGTVNVKDLIRLAQYIAKWNVTVVEAAIDTNGDGTVNVKDLIRLAQFIAKWDVLLGVETFTVTWVNYDGTVLETDKNVIKGTLPKYDGATPVKPDDDTYTYDFSGWSPAVENASRNVTYTAQFTQKALPVMTESYKSGIDSFYQISGIRLPELDDTELSEESTFDAQKKSAVFVIDSDAGAFAAIVEAVKAELADEPLSDNDNHWEDEGHFAFWEWDYEDGGRMHKVTIQLENNTMTGKITVGYWFRDYCTITLTAGTGGSAVLKIGGNGQNGNTAHVCSNTASDLYAEAASGYEFDGFYEGDNRIGTDNPLNYMIVKDVTIEARFREAETNMDEGYKAAKDALYAMSGIVLPALENAAAANEYIVPDEQEGIRDEFQCEFIFETADEASLAYADFKSAITAVDGDPEESMEMMDLWSVLYPDNAVPYRDDVMMNINGTSIFLMWRKQPIVFYSVSTEGNGSAYIPYIGPGYVEHHVDSYWETADAFHGNVVAVPGEGEEFLGWYVDGEQVSASASYYFNYDKDDVDFTEIVFTAKFTGTAQTAAEMTESYSKARGEFAEVTGVTLPELSGLVVGDYPYNHGETSYCFDIVGGDELSYATFTAFKSFFDEELSDWTVTGPSVDGEYTNVNYNSDSGWIGLTWDATNEAVYINTVMNG